MSKFFLRRALSSKPLYFILFVTIVIAFLHIFQEATEFENDLSYNYGVLNTPYQSWIEFGLGSYYRYILFLLLPLIAAIPMADMYAKDRQTGYLKSILSKGKMKKYFRGLYISNFLVAAIVIATPLLVNMYLAFMTLPNIKPDPLLDGNPKDIMSTMLPALYYDFPILHMLFYILLACLFAGMYASISLSVSLYVRNRFVILISAFLFNMGLSLIFEFMNKYEWIPINFLTQHSGQPYPSMVAMGIIFTVGMLGSTMLYTIGVKNRVIY